MQAASVITNSDTPLESRKAFFSSKDTLGAMAMKVHAWGTDIEPEGAAAVGVTTPSPGILPLYVERHEKSVICMVGAAAFFVSKARCVHVDMVDVAMKFYGSVFLVCFLLNLCFVLIWITQRVLLNDARAASLMRKARAFDAVPSF